MSVWSVKGVVRRMGKCVGIKAKPREGGPAEHEITNRYALWRAWELMGDKAPKTNNLFNQMLMLYEDVDFRVVVNGSREQIGFSLVNTWDNGALLTAYYDSAHDRWIRPQSGVLQDYEQHELLAQELVKKNLIRPCHLKGSMTGPYTQLEAPPETRRQREMKRRAIEGSSYHNKPLWPWLTMCNGFITPWSDWERARRERNRLTPRNLWDAIVCAGAGVPRGSTFDL